jgi:uncharacterized damage-inducible protein DinB
MKNDANFIEGLRRAYRRCHLHAERMIEGLEDDHLQIQLQGTKESIGRVLQHIINAESYWLEQVQEPRPEFVKRPSLATARSSMADLEKRYMDLLNRRGLDKSTDPTPAWIALRVSQHGIYHCGQIALIRRLIGVPSVEVGETAPLTWESAVDAVSDLALDSGSR